MTTPRFVLAALLCLPAGAAAAETGGHHRHEEGSLPAAAELCSCGQAVAAKGGGRCTVWHCHPGEAEAHKVPWKPGKAAALRTGKKDALPESSDACRDKAPAKGLGVAELHSCQAWEARPDCSSAEPALITRCTETLDPAFRFSRKDEKGSECQCAEWKAVSDTRTCTAFMCRPKRKG